MFALQAWDPEFRPHELKLGIVVYVYNPSTVKVKTDWFLRLSGHQPSILSKLQVSERPVSNKYFFKGGGTEWISRFDSDLQRHTVIPTESISIFLFLYFCYFYKLLQFLTHQLHCLLVEAFSNCRSHCKWSSHKSRAQMITCSVIVLWFIFEPSFYFDIPIIQSGSNRLVTHMFLRLMFHSHLYSLSPLDHIFFPSSCATSF